MQFPETPRLRKKWSQKPEKIAAQSLKKSLCRVHPPKNPGSQISKGLIPLWQKNGEPNFSKKPSIYEEFNLPITNFHIRTQLKRPLGN